SPNLPRDKALGRIGKENLCKYLTHQPLAYLRMSAAKFWNIFNRGSSPYMRDWGWVAYHRALMLLGLAGFALLAWPARTRWRALLLGAPIACIAVLGPILLAVAPRQVPLMPLVCTFAGIAGGVAVFAVVGLFVLTVRSLLQNGRIERKLSATLEGIAWEEFRAAGLPERFRDRVAVVIPAYNEEDNIAHVLQRIPDEVCGIAIA